MTRYFFLCQLEQVQEPLSCVQYVQFPFIHPWLSLLLFLLSGQPALGYNQECARLQWLIPVARQRSVHAVQWR